MVVSLKPGFNAKSLFMALTAVLTTAVAPAAEAVWPKNSASEFSIYVTLLRFRIYADHCSAELPQLKPKFETLVEHMTSRVQGISQSLLASEVFKGMKGTPVPDEIVDGFKDGLDDIKHNFERRDAASICPKTLQSLGEMDDESLKSDLSGILKSAQNMIRNIEKATARQALSEEVRSH